MRKARDAKLETPRLGVLQRVLVSCQMKEKSDELTQIIPLGVVIALAVPGAMALAQEQGQQMPMMDQGMHGTMGQQMDRGVVP